MKRHLKIITAVAAFGFSVASGCNCGEVIGPRRDPDIQLLAQSVDFESVQVNQTHQKTLKLRNAGAEVLIIDGLRTSRPVFAVTDALPITVAVGEEIELHLTFSPTRVNQRETANLVIVSNDPDTSEATVQLFGTGIQAVASASPSPLAFGEVYVNETKTITLKIQNAGKNELVVLGAEFLPETPPTITAEGDLAPIRVNIPSGGFTEVDVTFAPTDMVESIPGGIKLRLDPIQVQSGELVVTFTGRGIRSIPRMCFQFDGEGTEKCTSASASGAGGFTLAVTYPALCDWLLYPPDAGFGCGDTPYEKTGKLYLRNEGNTPVDYTMSYEAATGKSCDGGTPRIDFEFSNAPGPAVRAWNEDRTTLAPGATTPEISVTYRPTSECELDGADQARVLFTRQGDMRSPGNLFATITGQSGLPEPSSETASFTIQNLPSAPQPFFGAVNRGSADFEITAVEMWWLLDPVQGNSCVHPAVATDAGVPFTLCRSSPPPSDFDDPQSWCHYFNWAPGLDPNIGAPHNIPAATDAGVGFKEIGKIVFGPATKPTSHQAVCVWAKVFTSDPYNPVLLTKIQGIWVP